MLHQFVRQCDTTVDRSTGNTARTLHPLRGTAPVTGRYTRYGALHPIRTGVMPTDRVHCTLKQEQTRNLQAPATTPNTTPTTRHRALHPLRGTAPVTGRYTRYGAQHPIRTGAMPTDRVHCTLRQEQTRNLKAHTTHGTGELARKVRQPPAHQAPPATTEHRPAHSPTWWQRGSTPAHVNPPGDNIGTPAQPPVNGGSCAQVG